VIWFETDVKNDTTCQAICLPFVLGVIGPILTHLAPSVPVFPFVKMDPYPPPFFDPTAISAHAPKLRLCDPPDFFTTKIVGPFRSSVPVALRNPVSR
jgi:hypothetical protein